MGEGDPLPVLRQTGVIGVKELVGARGEIVGKEDCGVITGE